MKTVKPVKAWAVFTKRGRLRFVDTSKPTITLVANTNLGESIERVLITPIAKKVKP